jgi:hypothetical protein
MNAHKVLRAASLTGSDNYRKAVARIIDDIQRDHGCDLVDIAEAIDVSVGTVSNAANCKADLSGVYLFRIAQRFGAGYLNPCLNIANAQAAPLDGTLTSDILPMVMAVAHKIACARDPAGPGGVVEVPQEKRAYLPDLKRLNQRSGCLIQEIEAVA